MSGITNFTKSLLQLVCLMLLASSFATLSATEKTVKVKAGQGLASQQADKSEQSIESRHSELSTMKSFIGDAPKSSYKDISSPSLFAEKEAAKSDQTKISAQKQLRDENITAPLKSSSFYFDRVNVYMNVDLDNDGYYSDFTVNFDADTDYHSATVYALLYLSFEGGPWELYYTTDYFVIDGYSAYDDFNVSTLLTSGYPPGRYDILIDLYDEYDHTLVATISPEDTYELAEYYLEDSSYETNSGQYGGFSIFDASITLLTDNDNDGFYQSFSLQFDADVDSGDALVYAEIWVRDSYGDWQQDYVTEDFWLEGYSTLDTYILETRWEEGYSSGYYDFRIEIYDAYDGTFLTSSSELNEYLYEVPLEDASSDYHSGGSGGGTYVATSVSIGVAGAGGMDWL
ncbi:MAG: hypothetical protein DRQ47_10115, partial [Gammaproteobacteria bacterium]